MQFDNLKTAIQQGIDRNMHTGVQVYVSVDSRPILDEGFGSASADVRMSAATIMLWRSAGKPITAAAVCRAAQNGNLNIDAPLAEFLPSVTDLPVGAARIRSLLIHSSGLPLIDTGWPELTWQQTVHRICNIERLAPANAYQPQSTWFLLGALLEAIDARNRSLQTILAEDVLQPLGIQDVWCGIPEDDKSPHACQRSILREAGKLVASDFSGDRWLSQPSPGGNFRGPISQLGRFYEMLLNDGRASNGTQFLSAETVSAMTSRHRIGTKDETFQHVVDFGLGVIIDSNQYGSQTVPYGFGKNCSSQTFGHGGAQCSMGFCDPERQLVVAWAANGFCGEGQHQRRNRAFNDAIYEDLGS